MWSASDIKARHGTAYYSIYSPGFFRFFAAAFPAAFLKMSGTRTIVDALVAADDDDASSGKSAVDVTAAGHGGPPIA